MAGEGSKQVPVVGKEDKREITVLLTISASGVHYSLPRLFTKGRFQNAMLR